MFLIPSSLAIRARGSAFRRLMALPPTWLRRMSGPQIVVEGQRLDVQIQAMLTAIRLARLRPIDDVETSRRAMDREAPLAAPTQRLMRQIRQLRIQVDGAQIAARLYVPFSAAPNPPLLVFCHGGGFVVGSLTSHDAVLRDLAHRSEVALLAIQYRLAPEHKAPTAVDDAYRAYVWARANASSFGVDAERIAVGGDSAGANLSAVVSHRCRERNVRMPDAQVLIYPATDMTCTAASHSTFAKGFLLEGTLLDWFFRHYLIDDNQRRSPEVSPLFSSHFDGLPPTILVTAGFDPLRDEGAAYAERLRDAGVRVVYRCETSLVHGFFNLSGVVSAAAAASEAIAVDIRDTLVGGGLHG